MSPGIRKIAKRFNLEQAGHYYAGSYKNCFLLLHAGTDMKVVKITFPMISENDKRAVRNILSNYDFLSAHWIYAKLIIQFSELIWYYPLHDIIKIITSIADYSAMQYPGLVPVCGICKSANKSRVYFTKYQVFYVCDSCRQKISQQKYSKRDESGSKTKGFLSGLLGAVSYTTFGIIASMLCYILFSDFAVLVAAGYYTFARYGYEKYRGNLTLFGVCIVFIVGFVSTVVGAYCSCMALSVSWLSGFSNLLAIVMPEKECQKLIVLSMLTYVFFQLFSDLQVYLLPCSSQT